MGSFCLVVEQPGGACTDGAGSAGAFDAVETGHTDMWWRFGCVSLQTSRKIACLCCRHDSKARVSLYTRKTFLKDMLVFHNFVENHENESS